jgi:hypothetical protein
MGRFPGSCLPHARLMLTRGAGAALLLFGSCSHDWDAVYDSHVGATSSGGEPGDGGRAPQGADAGGGGTAAAAGGSGGSAAAATAGAASVPVAAGSAGSAGAEVAGSGGSAGAAGSAGLGGAAGSAGGSGSYCALNLVPNPSFETRTGLKPDGWELYAELNGSGGDWVTTTAQSYAGSRSLELDTLSLRDTGGGAYELAVATVAHLPVTAGEILAGLAAARVEELGTAAARLRVVFYDSSDNHLSGLDSEAVQLPQGARWQLSEPFYIEVPAGAEAMQLIISVGEGTLAHIDSVCITREGTIG